MEKEMINLIISKWNDFCERGYWNADLYENQEPKDKSFKAFMEWLKWNKD